MIKLACLCLFLMGAGLAFGPLNVKTDKLRPGESPQEAIKKTRRMGYLLMGLSVLILLGANVLLVQLLPTILPNYPYI